MDKSELVEFAIKKYGREISGIAKKYYIHDGGYEDLLQEGLIGVVQAVNSYDFSKGDQNSDSFKKFILMCAKRQILDAIKKSNRRKNEPLNSYVAFDQSLENINFSWQSDPEDDFINKESIDNTKPIYVQINTGLNTIDPLKYGAQKPCICYVLNLYLDGKKQSEIANILGKPVKSVDNTLQRVKNKIKGSSK